MYLSRCKYMKYFINTNTNDGICKCNSVCDGKGLANGDGDCKKITIAVFKSGKTIVRWTK